MPSELLKNLMTQATAGRLVLPDFQRDFVWKPSDVSKLLASLLNGYPIGGLLFMENPGIYGHRPLDGAKMVADESPGDTRLILDGQQRLRALELSSMALASVGIQAVITSITKSFSKILSLPTLTWRS